MLTDENNTIRHNKRRHYGILQYFKMSLEHNRLGEMLVLKGLLQPWELKSALKRQKSQNRPLGKILIDDGIISSHQLRTILFQQKATRVIVAALLLFSSMNALPKRAHAGSIKDIPSRVMLASAHNASFNSNPIHSGTLFGAEERRSKDLKAFTKWSDMFQRFDQEMQKSSSQKIIKELKADLAQFKSSSIYNMARQVNDLMNKTTYINDDKNWGKSDYWATPIEFLTRGGDCEDFAIAKYVALRALGVPENKMRIAIVQDLQKNIPHAILIVYTERGTVILDNQIKTVRLDSEIHHYKPIFSINRTAWWLHTTPRQSTQTIVASAK